MQILNSAVSADISYWFWWSAVRGSLYIPLLTQTVLSLVIATTVGAFEIEIYILLGARIGFVILGAFSTLRLHATVPCTMV